MGVGPAQPERRAVVSWVLYDLANTIFSMGVVSLYFPMLVRDAVGVERADRTFGLIAAASMLVIFAVSPLFGALTDRARRRMPFLMACTVICVAFTMLLAWSGFRAAAVCFIIANIAYQAGLQVYDALLPVVSTEDNRGRIGGIGVGVGYLGSFLAVSIGLVVTDNLPVTFMLVAGLFLLFALPCFLFVREPVNPHPRPITLVTIRESTRETLRTLRSSRQYPGLARFLVGRVFYTDAINTVINVMALYTINVAVTTGLSESDGKTQASFVMLAAISCAVAGGFLWGVLTDRLGPKRVLNYVLRAWMAVFVGAGLVGVLGLPMWALYVVTCAAGLALGGVWAADRPYMLRLTPPDRVGEFYGLYGMVGRFSAITGPLIWAGITWVTVETLGLRPAVGQGIALFSLLLLVIPGYVILQKVSDTPLHSRGADHRL
jgi:UMF1 family MFS transporter